MKKTCLIISGKKYSDDCFEPDESMPDKHWAYMLLDSYAVYNDEKRRIEYPKGIGIQWNDDISDVITIKISPELWNHNEACFEHLMSFIKQNELTYEFPCNMEACDTCEVHPSCISNEHSISAAFGNGQGCDTSSHAA